MEVKYSTLLLLFSITPFECLPVYVDDDINCNFPPLLLTASDDWDICSSARAQSHSDDDNDDLKFKFFEPICTQIGMLQKDDCSALKAISFPFESVLTNMFDFHDDQEKRSKSEELCKSMSKKGMKNNEDVCKEMCLEAISVCYVYVITEEILRNNFSKAVHKDYRQLENFIHPKELDQYFVFPPRGSLHEGGPLLQCMHDKPGNETDALCKAVAEVAINISDTRTVLTKMAGFSILKNASSETSPWEPCDSLPYLLNNVDCDCMKVLKNKTSCKDLCTKGGLQICRMIYFGLESLHSKDGTSTGSATVPSINLEERDERPSPKPDNSKLDTPKPDTPKPDTPKPEAGTPAPPKPEDTVSGDGSTHVEDSKAESENPTGAKNAPNIPEQPKNNLTETMPGAKIEKANLTTASTSPTPVGNTSCTTTETVKQTTPTKEQELPKKTDVKNENAVKTTQDKTGPSTTTTETPAVTESTTAENDPMSTEYGDGASVDPNDNNEEGSNYLEGLENKLGEQGGVLENKKNMQEESRKPSTDVDEEEEEGSGGHFMAYFLVFIVLCVAGYIVFHNKQKIIALVIEGKNASGGRRPSSKDYKKLKTEDVMPSLEKSAYSKNYVF